MDLLEYNPDRAMDESKHWWIRTRFLQVERALSICTPKKVDVLELGCGTGQNLFYLRTQSPHRRRIGVVAGVDTALSEDVSYDWNEPGDRISAKIPSDKKYDLMLAMDVLEHIEDPRAVLKEYLAHLKPGGVLLVTVPAFNILWSQHDEFLGHKRRYTLSMLKRDTDDLDLKMVASSYLFSYLFFPLVFIRLILRRKSNNENPGLTLPPAWMNSILLYCGRIEFWLRGSRLIGTSLYGLYRKEK